MSRLALFPGTFDPFTLGHLDIARRALKLFDEVEIIVAVNPEKATMMPAEQRAELIRQATTGISNLSVRTFQGLTALHACAREATALVRGVRSALDFVAEAKMALANRQLCPGLDTVYLVTAPEHAHTSSSLVRDIARWGGNLESFVPPCIADALHCHFAHHS